MKVEKDTFHLELLQTLCNHKPGKAMNNPACLASVSTA